MFAPAGQTTARAGLRSKLAALVVRRQAPPNPRCRKQQSVGAGHARPATYRGNPSTGNHCTLRRGGLPPSLAPLVRNPLTSVRREGSSPLRCFPTNYRDRVIRRGGIHPSRGVCVSTRFRPAPAYTITTISYPLSPAVARRGQNKFTNFPVDLCYNRKSMIKGAYPHYGLGHKGRRRR